MSSKPTIIFVPFFGGRKPSLKKHFEYVESLGYSWKFVDIDFNLIDFFKTPISARSEKFGMKTQWADAVEAVLNETSGPKIIFSMSNPTAGVIELSARRQAQDILGLIADGGPSGELWTSILGYFTVEKPLPTWPLKAAAAAISTFLIDPKLKNICQKDLENFPEQFPILSIRGWKDPMITPRQIDMVFEPHHQLRWQKLSLPEGGHINGLRDFPKDYKEGLERFLENILPKASQMPLQPQS